jgi:esterase/lipase superfamily enzyme
MANIPSMFELAVPAAAGLLYALIWYSTRTLPRAGRILGRVASLLVLVPAVFYLSFGMPLQRDRVSQSPPVGSRDEATRVPEDDMRRRAPEPQTSAPPAPAPGPRGGDTAEVQPPPPPPPVPTQPSRAPRATPPADKPGDPAGGGGPPPGVPAAEKADWDVVPVFYGTDRVRKDDPKRIAYTSDRARRLELGRALVTVPKAHQVPNIERPFAIRLFNVTIYEQAEDPKQHFTIRELKALARDDFLALVRERVGGGRSFKDQAIVFVHGYNTAFDYALYRSAQMAYDLKFDGASFLYSWPSGGGVAGYGYDRESATQTEPYLKEFLSLVLKDSGAKSVSVIAHSMGNLPLLNVLRDLGPALPPDVRLNEIILAAPDVDRDVFAYLATNIQQYGRGVTLYCSANDRAMAASRRVAGGVPRAGDVPADGPIVISGIDTIDVTQTSTDVLALNHSSYAEKSALLNDIGLLLQTGERPPEKRIPILQKISTPKGDYFWRYPVPSKARLSAGPRSRARYWRKRAQIPNPLQRFRSTCVDMRTRWLTEAVMAAAFCGFANAACRRSGLPIKRHSVHREGSL